MQKREIVQTPVSKCVRTTNLSCPSAMKPSVDVDAMTPYFRGQLLVTVKLAMLRGYSVRSAQVNSTEVHDVQHLTSRTTRAHVSHMHRLRSEASRIGRRNRIHRDMSGLPDHINGVVYLDAYLPRYKTSLTCTFIPSETCTCSSRIQVNTCATLQDLWFASRVQDPRLQDERIRQHASICQHRSGIEKAEA